MPGGPNSGTVTVTDKMGNVTSHTFSLIGGSTCGPWETKTQYFQGVSTLLKEIDTTYSNTGTDYANPTNFSNYIAVGVFPNTVTTSLYTNASPLISQSTSQYDTFGSYQDYSGITHHFSFGQVLSSTESDFGSTTPLRTTLHTKQWQSNWNYYARNLIDLPCLDTVMGQGYVLPQPPTTPQPSCIPPTAPATQAAQTIYGYDNPSYTSNAVTWGLPTSVTRWNPTNPVNPTTDNYYGTTSSCGTSAFLGMPIEKLDANGNPTYLCYDLNGLYLNQIIYADNSKEYPTYDKYTGLLTSDTDVNRQTTTYTYDSMRRLTGVTYPKEGGWETLAYNDSPGSLSVNFNKAITSTTMLSKKAYADGLGRLTQTQLTSDPNGTDYTVTTYDSLGRVASVSNPYREGESYEITTYTYDALNRKAIVTAPDGTKKQACFNGISTVGQSNCYSNQLVNVGAWEDDADENGNDWQRIQNALGQITFVFEPSGLSSSPYMETAYAYDVLNNLLTVNQWGGLDGTFGERAARGFAYDKLSQLLTSSNPETGQSIYTYDANGNVKSRVDARGVTTTYNYDKMNRLFCKSYTGDVNNTPSSSYLYGTSTGYVGRLVNAWTSSSSAGACPATAPLSPPATGVLTMRTIGSYDSMGRITAEKQSTLANSAGYSLTYSYDLAGDLILSSDGVATTPLGAPISFISMFDGAGRLQTLTSSWSDITHPAALFLANPSSATPSYAAFGGLTNATFGINSAFGNKSAVSLNRTYDTRLRITGETDTGGGSNPASGSATVTITGQEQTK
jgi:YD repeat-containing protein